MKFKMLISAMMSVAVIFSSLCVGAFAYEKKEPGKKTYVNPHYSSVLSEGDIQKKIKKQEKPQKYNAVYQNYQSSVSALREALKARKTTIEINLILDSSKYNVEDKMYELFDDAVAHTGNPTEGDYIDWQYGGFQIEYSYTSNSKIDIIYYVYYYTTAAQEAKVDKEVDSLLKNLNLNGKSDYQKVKAIYDYMCDNIVYDYDHLYDESYDIQYTAYGAIVDKICVCQGYSVLFYRLALEADVDARVIVGIAAGGNHAWNIARVGAKYYLLDSTWDAESDEYSCFLKGKDNFLDHVCDSKYDEDSFEEKYPISENDYGDTNPPKRIVQGQAGDDITWSFNKDTGVLSFEGQGKIYDWTSSDYYIDYSPWTNYFKQIKEITIGEGITSIGDEAFYYLGYVENIKIPKSLKRVGAFSFAGCESITNIYYTSNQSNWNKIRFEAESDEEYLSFADLSFVSPGDINFDDKVNSTDALEVLKNATGLVRLNVGQAAAADVNSDTAINSTDALFILQISTGLVKI